MGRWGPSLDTSLSKMGNSVLIKEKGALGLKVFLRLIRPSFENGVGTLRMREGFYGTK